MEPVTIAFLLKSCALNLNITCFKKLRRFSLEHYDSRYSCVQFLNGDSISNRMSDMTTERQRGKARESRSGSDKDLAKMRSINAARFMFRAYARARVEARYLSGAPRFGELSCPAAQNTKKIEL